MEIDIEYLQYQLENDSFNYLRDVINALPRDRLNDICLMALRAQVERDRAVARTVASLFDPTI